MDEDDFGPNQPLVGRGRTVNARLGVMIHCGCNFGIERLLSSSGKVCCSDERINIFGEREAGCLDFTEID